MPCCKLPDKWHKRAFVTANCCQRLSNRATQYRTPLNFLLLSNMYKTALIGKWDTKSGCICWEELFRFKNRYTYNFRWNPYRHLQQQQQKRMLALGVKYWKQSHTNQSIDQSNSMRIFLEWPKLLMCRCTLARYVSFCLCVSLSISVPVTDLFGNRSIILLMWMAWHLMHFYCMVPQFQIILLVSWR